MFCKNDSHFQGARIVSNDNVPLVFFEIIEYQLPKRVARQFNMSLIIPHPPPSDMTHIKGVSDVSFTSHPPFFSLCNCVERLYEQ